MDLSMTELERDIIREILNIGLARAADSFAVIAQERVLLEVPSIDLLMSNDILSKVREYQARHVPIQSDIRGDFNGTTLMFFSGQHVQRLSRVCLRMQTSAESLEVNELQESLLLEISNIITGALVTQLANILKANIYGAPPVAPHGDIAESMQNLVPEQQLQPLIFSVITQFSDRDNMVELPLMLFFDRVTFEKILEIIRSYDFLGRQMSA